MSYAKQQSKFSETDGVTARMRCRSSGHLTSFIDSNKETRTRRQGKGGHPGLWEGHLIDSWHKVREVRPQREIPRLRPQARSVERSGDQKGFVRRDHGWMDGRTGSVANRRLSKGKRRDGKVKSQGKGEKVALYSAAAICQTPSAEEGITG